MVGGSRMFWTPRLCAGLLHQAKLSVSLRPRRECLLETPKKRGPYISLFGGFRHRLVGPEGECPLMFEEEKGALKVDFGSPRSWFPVSQATQTGRPGICPVCERT